MAPRLPPAGRPLTILYGAYATADVFVTIAALVERLIAGGVVRAAAR